MKRTVVSVAIAFLIAGIAATPTSAQEYRVVEGDSLWRIAKEHETTVERIMELNDLETDLIHPNQLLEVKSNGNYIVKRGDTLSTIAAEYDIEVEDLKIWNQLESDLILVDQELVVTTENEDQVEDQEVEQEQVAVLEEMLPSNHPLALEIREKIEKEQAAVQAAAKKLEEAKQTLTVTATAYTAKCTGCSGITATGINLLEDRNKKVIAVDPRVIPLGTKVYVEGYGEAIAGDTGGAIKGHKIDIHLPTKEEAFAWGVRTVQVTLLN